MTAAKEVEVLSSSHFNIPMATTNSQFSYSGKNRFDCTSTTTTLRPFFPYTTNDDVDHRKLTNYIYKKGGSTGLSENLPLAFIAYYKKMET